ncbi:hypothetical protein F2Q70_00026772 [Brassica cretica]|uniref:Uncharacterized protein n=1 Tax=Brassica cretica TaxID=69181 RepID=A0A8S9LBM5_BRACR|nr:hypothetical protein F2Q68_00026339 [Brassica cretica]KAF2604814.1 hypothetical protein F2Q70_00026772 [Brassica cretica]
MAVLEKARVAKQYCSTLRSSKHVYEVNEFECGYSVNLATHQCACRKWDLTGKSTRHGRIPHCSQCKQAGHIKTSCKNEHVTVEGPKNRWGRPRKHPNEVKPHVKKAPTGRPLKIRKTAAIPFGVGTFWSPYTDHPFEIFGDRVYDRSNLNPQDPNIHPAQGESSHPPTD